MGSFRSIGDQLRQARQAKGVSLDDISASTRILKKYLEDIESGTVPPMPMTYVRAFIRAYADQVGIAGDDLLHDLDAPAPPAPSEAAPGVQAQPAPQAPAAPEGHPPAGSRPRQTTVVIVVSLLLILALAVLLVWTNRDRPREPVQEIAFSDVVKERDGAQAAADSAAVAAAAPAPQLPARTDSLLLEAVASESVWVNIVIDDAEKKEYLFSPLYHLRWKAKKSFTVSVGNGAGISFTLNGQKVGFLGTGRRPVRNIVLGWQTVEQLAKNPPPKAPR